jgi:hypothetical protein
MWGSLNNFDYFQFLSESENELLHKTTSNFKIPPSGVVIVFDRNDYHLSSLYSDKSIWKNLGNHLNLQVGDGDYEFSPPDIKEIINSFCFSHMVWLSKRAWAVSEIDFVWNLSHELRHLEQDLENRYFSLSGWFLYSNLRGVDIEEPKIDITVPTELDAELAAWRTVRKIFGIPSTDNYVQKLCKQGEKQESFRILLSKHDPEIQYDVRYKTISFLRKYESKLNEVINNVYGKSSLLQNIDHICSKLSE